MATGVVEVDRADEAVVDRSKYIDVVLHQILVSGIERIYRRYFECQMLGPVRIIGLSHGRFVN